MLFLISAVLVKDLTMDEPSLTAACVALNSCGHAELRQALRPIQESV